MMTFEDALYEYDYYHNVNEDYMIDEKNGFTVLHYLAGRCHLFALKMNELLGLDVGLYLDMEPLDDNFDMLPHAALEHAFCHLTDEDAFDGQGARSYKENYNTFCWNTNNFEQIKGDDAVHLLKDWISKDLLFNFEPGEEDALTAYILKIKEHQLLKEIDFTPVPEQRVKSIFKP